MPQKNNKKKINVHLPKLMILLGIGILVIVIFMLKSQQEKPAVSLSTAPRINETVEEQFDRYVEEGKPVFAFFHSYNCQSCLDMMETVSQVYPAFEDQIALVDVDVYDEANQNLLQRAGIYSIPTQIFIDITGEGMVTIGAMTKEELTQQFNNLLGEK